MKGIASLRGYQQGGITSLDPEEKRRRRLWQLMAERGDTKEENRRRAMAGEEGYATIGPRPSWAERVAAQLRSVPRRIDRALQPETAGETAGLVAASMVPGVGEGIDMADIIAGARTGDIPRMGWGVAGLALPLVAGSTLRRVAQRVAKAADELPMDEASRVARAEEMEFDLDVYHGTPEDIKGPFRESGFAPELGYGEIGSGVYVAPNPKDVERYTTNARSLHPSDPNVTTGSIHPLRVRSKKLLSSDSPEFKELVDDVIHNDPYFGPKTRDKTGPYFQPGGWGYSEASERARKLAAERGWEGFYEPREEYINRRWVKLPDAKDSRQIVIFDPKNLRSRWAAFDPRERHSPNPLAGIAPLLGIGAAGAARRNYVERER